MKDNEKIIKVMGLINREFRHKIHNAIQANSEIGKYNAAKDSWDLYNPDDGVGSFSSNPYTSQLEAAKKHYGQCSIELAEWQEILEYFITTFIESKGE